MMVRKPKLDLLIQMAFKAGAGISFRINNRLTFPLFVGVACLDGARARIEIAQAELGLLEESGVRSRAIAAVRGAGLDGYGLRVVERVPLEIPANTHNLRYLAAKRDKMGHYLAQPHTLRNMRRMWQPRYFGREMWEEWEYPGVAPIKGILKAKI